MLKKILVVDDEQKIVEVVKSYLEHNNYQVFTAFNGNQAITEFERVNPDLIILDLMLPDVSGEEVCQRLRKKSNVPIIMLTAKVEEEDILKGLNIGADDYVLKPFSPKQLIARVAAVLRRSYNDGQSETDIFMIGDMVLDNTKHELKKQHNIINLTPNEYKILLAMLKYPNKTFTRDELIAAAFGYDFEGFDRTIDTHIKNLRHKIEDEPKYPRYLQTVHGVGYKISGE